MASMQLSVPKFGTDSHVDNNLKVKGHYKVTSPPKGPKPSTNDKSAIAQAEKEKRKQEKRNSLKKRNSKTKKSTDWSFDDGYGVDKGK